MVVLLIVENFLLIPDDFVPSFPLVPRLEFPLPSISLKLYFIAMIVILKVSIGNLDRIEKIVKCQLMSPLSLTDH